MFGCKCLRRLLEVVGKLFKLILDEVGTFSFYQELDKRTHACIIKVELAL